MAYSESRAGRLRDVLARSRGVVEKKMFGGVVFLLDGNMLVGVWKDSLIARLGPQPAADALSEPPVGRVGWRPAASPIRDALHRIGLLLDLLRAAAAHLADRDGHIDLRFGRRGRLDRCPPPLRQELLKPVMRVD